MLNSRVDRVPSQADDIAEQIRNGSVYTVSEYGDAIVGFACASSSRDENYPNDGEIQSLYVLKGFQRWQIGRQLFENCIHKLQQSGHEHLIVNCLKDFISEWVE